MIIHRDDPRFWDVRLLDRRVRRGELIPKDMVAFLDSLPDVTDKGTASKPLDEPDERARERRPAVRITATMPTAREFDDDDDMLDDDLIDDEDEDDDDEDFDG